MLFRQATWSTVDVLRESGCGRRRQHCRNTCAAGELGRVHRETDTLLTLNAFAVLSDANTVHAHITSSRARLSPQLKRRRSYALRHT